MYAYVVLFVSRNKDNAGVEGFKPRTHSFLTHDPEACYDSFRKFVDEGVNGQDPQGACLPFGHAR